MRRSAWMGALAVMVASSEAGGLPPPRPTACGLAQGQTFTGSYLCAQGETALTLRVLGVDGASVWAEFVFDHSPTRARGSYTLRGQCAGGEVTLNPDTWIARPDGYIMVGMRGRLEGARYSGQITHPSCSGFLVMRR